MGESAKDLVVLGQLAPVLGDFRFDFRKKWNRFERKLNDDLAAVIELTYWHKFGEYLLDLNLGFESEAVKRAYKHLMGQELPVFAMAQEGFFPEDSSGDGSLVLPEDLDSQEWKDAVAMTKGFLASKQHVFSPDMSLEDVMRGLNPRERHFQAKKILILYTLGRSEEVGRTIKESLAERHKSSLLDEICSAIEAELRTD